MKNRFVAGAMSALLIATGAVLGLAAPASAHTGDLDATAECIDGSYVVTYKLTVSNTDLAGSTVWRVGGDDFEGTPGSAANMDRGPVATNGSGVYTLGSITLPGDSTQAPWAYAWSVWSDTFAYGSDGGDIGLDGDCAVAPDVAKGDWGYNPGTCLVGQTLSISNANLTNATWTPESLAKNGTAGPAEFDLIAVLNPNAVWADGFNGTFHVVLTGPDTTLCPTNQECPAYGDGGKATDLNLNGWNPAHDTRSAGHWEFVNSGLRIFTDNASSDAKVSWAKAVTFPLTTTGALDLDYSSTFGGQPGLNLFVDFDNNGSVDGTLVYEAVYGQDLWLTGGSAAFVKSNAPVVGGGNGSQWHGTINQWLTKFPSAQVQGIAFALGSGVHADGVLTSVTVGCLEYTFGRSPKPPVEDKQVVTEGEPNCYVDAVAVTTKFYEKTYSWNGTAWVASEWTLTNTTVVDRPLTEEEVAKDCLIEDVPTASLVDQCGVGGYKATLSTPSSDAWAWGEPVVGNEKYIVTAVAAGEFHFAEDVQTVFSFPLDDSLCPFEFPTLSLPTLPLTGGGEMPLWPIGLAGMMLLLGAGGVVLATRRQS